MLSGCLLTLLVAVKETSFLNLEAELDDPDPFPSGKLNFTTFSAVGPGSTEEFVVGLEDQMNFTMFSPEIDPGKVVENSLRTIRTQTTRCFEASTRTLNLMKWYEAIPERVN